MRTKLLSLAVSLTLVQGGIIQADTLAAGSSTALNPQVAAETKRVVNQIEQLAEDARLGAPQFSMIGSVTGGGNSWWVHGEEFSIDDSTVITGELLTGKTVEVRGFLGSGRKLLARHVTVLPGSTDSTQIGRSISPAEARALR